MNLLPALSLAVLGTALSAQTSFAYNKVEFGNWWIADREDLFPNYATPAGNVAGDALFKVFPGEVFERAEPHRLSGYQIAISIDDAYTGPFPVEVALPAMQLYRTRFVTLAGTEYEVPDLAQPVGPRFDPVPITIPSDNAWVVEVRFHPSNSNPRTRGLLALEPAAGAPRRGVAVMVLGRPGDRRAPNVPGVVLQSSFAERHLPPGRASHSGSYDATTGTLRMFGTTGMPSATGELYVGLRFHGPTLQLAGSSAGGFVGDPQNFETQLGPGAYATDLGRRLTPGDVRFYVQAEQFDPGAAPPTHVAFPFIVALGGGGPSVSVPFGPAPLRLDPAALGIASLLADAGLSGPLVRLRAASGAGFDADQLGVFNSVPLRVAPSAALVGRQLWVQALVTTVGFVPVASTNVVRLTL
jgi:hypothetical protein